MDKAIRSAKRFFVGENRIHVPVEQATPVVTFHRDFLLTLDISDHNDVERYLDQFMYQPIVQKDEGNRYFWAYSMNGPNGIDVFRYSLLENLESDKQKR